MDRKVKERLIERSTKKEINRGRNRKEMRKDRIQVWEREKERRRDGERDK